VLMARAFVGTSTGDRLPQGVFQMGGDLIGAVAPEDPGDATLGLDDLSLVLRGYPENAFRGSKAGLVTLEYRFPITNLEKGFSSKPLFLRRFHGAVFAEAGNVWDNTFHQRDVKSSAGAEARLDIDIGYGIPATLRAGIAQGFNKRGETRPYFGLWLPLNL
jgi:outer membrane protein assembly factor BamA